MPLELDVKYIRSKKKVAKKIGLNVIEETETLFRNDPNHVKLNLKSIVCKRDKHKQSIRVLGNSGYRILITTKEDSIYFQDIMNHDKYDRLTHDC